MKGTLRNLSALCSKVLVISFLCSSSVYASWLDDFYGNTVHTNPTAFETQSAHYFIAGGFTQRISTKNTPLMSIALPSVSVGCGGIDTFFGGASFLDFDYMVSRAESVLKNAEYVLFSLGLKALSTQFGDTIESVQALIDQLNQLSLDECAAAEGLVTMVTQGDASALTSKVDAITTAGSNLVTGFTSDWLGRTAQVENNLTTETTKIIDAKIHDTVVNKILKTDGYLLDTLAHNDIKLLTQNEANVMRALFGDIQHKGLVGNVNDGEVIAVTGCASDYDLQQYTYEPVPKQVAGSMACTIDSAEPIATRADDALLAIIDALTDDAKRKTSIDANMMSFINSADVPVYSYLASASVAGHNYLIGIQPMLKDIVATGYAYSSIKRLQLNIKYVMRELRTRTNAQKIYIDKLLNALAEYEKVIDDKMDFFQNEYNNAMASMNNTFEFSKQMESESSVIRDVRTTSILMHNSISKVE